MQRLDKSEFGRLITQAQRPLFALIRTLVFDEAAVEDVLQETNLALWSQADRFEPGTNFAAWAGRVAYFKVLAYRRDCCRDRLRFGDELLEQLAEEATAELDEFEAQKAAILGCFQALPPERRQVLDLYFGKRWSLAQIGKNLGKTTDAVKQLMVRVRAALRTCMQRRLELEGRSRGS